jgi:hypothetical protein
MQSLSADTGELINAEGASRDDGLFEQIESLLALKESALPINPLGKRVDRGVALNDFELMGSDQIPD